MPDSDMSDYDVGYQEGENSGYADWMFALDEAFDMGVASPKEAVEHIKELITAARQQGIEDVMAIIDKLAARYCHQRFIANHGEAYRLAVDAIGKSVRAEQAKLKVERLRKEIITKGHQPCR